MLRSEDSSTTTHNHRTMPKSRIHNSYLKEEKKTCERCQNLESRDEKPMEDIYGKEYFANTFSAVVDAMNQFYSKPDGNICRHLLPLIGCPTLIIHGMKDPVVPKSHPQFLHEHIKNSR
ncbi:unnamed protein product [Ranitomeya imitator]|uniref:Serine aminopeptidase S33 domain-containing protein n=1 Tax=Ranitomeya imitator TaxID=111125 RepID=A0ABN9LDZ2_9NEOB|nr:unnamed protein product [Ranitomeya imitator]